MRKDENGNILILSIFFMVILLIVAMGISSISTTSIENSLASEKDIKDKAKSESKVDLVVLNNEDSVTGKDRWNNSLLASEYLKENQVLKIFSEKYYGSDGKSVKYNFKTTTSAAITVDRIYFAIIGNNWALNINDVKINSSSPAWILQNDTITGAVGVVAYKSDNLAPITINPLDVFSVQLTHSGTANDEYTFLFRVFYD